MSAEKLIHCWEDGGEEIGSTCLLPDGHDGPHEFTPDSEIMVTFSESALSSEPQREAER